ncbi:MAG: DNA recombination protein RmuC [Thermomicrobium sp.]|nr:DNA recombination protein RmuC [Thermomicrobium sp.]
MKDTSLLIASAVGFACALVLSAAVGLLVWAARRPSGGTPEPGPVHATLGALQETLRGQSQQVADLARILQELATLTNQLQHRAETSERNQLELQATVQEALRSQAQQVSELARTMQELANLTTQLRVRTETSEQNQRQLQSAVQHVETLLTEFRTVLAALREQQGTTAGRIDQLQQALNDAQRALDELRRNDEEARRRQEELARFVNRLDAILTGSASRGAAGEHLLEAILEHLPPEFKAFNLTIKNRVVEFAFRLPNGKHVPVDSKWVGTRQLETLEETANEQARRELESQLERRIEEVAAYLDPELTLGLAIIAVPDAVYRWTQRLHARALERGIVVIAYSMAIPYFLTLLHFALRFLRDEESVRISRVSHQLEQALTTIQNELQGRYAKALTMLQNSRDTLAQQAASALGSLKQLQALSGAAPAALVGTQDEDDRRADDE